MYDMQVVDATLYQMACAKACGIDPIEAVGVECANYASSYLHAVGKDSPGKHWWNLPFDHPAIARALQIDRGADMAPFALMPFRYAKTEKGHRILAAYPCPRSIGASIDHDWLGIEAVIAWDPVGNTAEVEGDIHPQLVGDMRDDSAALFADPRAFFVEWARRRAAFAVRFQEAVRSAWTAKPAEPDLVPGALMIGKPEAIAWAPSALPEAIRCVGVDPVRVNKAILRSARLPRCFTEHRSAA